MNYFGADIVTVLFRRHFWLNQGMITWTLTANSVRLVLISECIKKNQPQLDLGCWIEPTVIAAYQHESLFGHWMVFPVCSPAMRDLDPCLPRGCSCVYLKWYNALTFER